MGKRKYKVYRVRTYYDDFGGIIKSEKESIGYTFAGSEKAAVNNVRFREKAGRKRSIYDGYGESCIVRTFEAVLA